MKKQNQIIQLILGLLSVSVVLVFVAIFMIFSSMSSTKGGSLSGALSTQVIQDDTTGDGLLAGGYDNDVDLELEAQTKSVDFSSETAEEKAGEATNPTDETPVSTDTEVANLTPADVTTTQGEVVSDDYPSYDSNLTDNGGSTGITSQTVTEAPAPQSGPAETVILIFAIVLGLLGSAIFLAIKLRGYN